MKRFILVGQVYDQNLLYVSVLGVLVNLSDINFDDVLNWLSTHPLFFVQMTGHLVKWNSHVNTFNEYIKNALQLIHVICMYELFCQQYQSISTDAKFN